MGRKRSIHSCLKVGAVFICEIKLLPGALSPWGAADVSGLKSRHGTLRALTPPPTSKRKDKRERVIDTRSKEEAATKTKREKKKEQKLWWSLTEFHFFFLHLIHMRPVRKRKLLLIIRPEVSWHWEDVNHGSQDGLMPPTPFILHKGGG